MLVYRIIGETSGPSRYYMGQTEASKLAREISKTGKVISVYKFSSPKSKIDKITMLAALNDEEWCEPTLVVQFENGLTKKV